MIGGVRGKLERIDLDVATIETAGGVYYEILVPLGVLGRLPAPGGTVHLFTELVVREDAWLLVGFDTPHERLVFRRLLTASGFGPRLALAVLSTLGPDRAVRAILNNDYASTTGCLNRECVASSRSVPDPVLLDCVWNNDLHVRGQDAAELISNTVQVCTS